MNMKRLVCVACSLLLIAVSVAALPVRQDEGQSIPVFTRRLSEEFPQINLDDIKLLEGYFTKLLRAGLQSDEAMRSGFDVMARGKALLSEGERSEMRGLTNQMKNTVTVKERERMQTLAAEIRRGKSISEADRKFIGAIIKESFLRLPAASQSRLRELYGKAIRAFLQTVQ
jgi:hypothetical protein